MREQFRSDRSTDSVLYPSHLILRTPAVLALIGLSRSSLWRRVRAGDFPAPVRLEGPGSRAVGWRRAGKPAAPAEAVAHLQKSAERTGLFEATGQSLNCAIDHSFTEDETNALVAWCESVGRAIREHAAPAAGRPRRTVLSRAEFLESCDEHGTASYSRILDRANRKGMSLK